MSDSLAEQAPDDDSLVARARAAMNGTTPGPWTSEFRPLSDGFECLRVTAGDVPVVNGCGCCGSPFGDNARDASFIADAHELVPEMADRIEVLKAALAAALHAMEAVERDCIWRAPMSADSRTVPIGATAWSTLCGAIKHVKDTVA